MKPKPELIAVTEMPVGILKESMKDKVYVVTMYRFGDREKHSYVLGVYTTPLKAKRAGEKERLYRGGTKYYPECKEMKLNKNLWKDCKIIVELP